MEKVIFDTNAYRNLVGGKKYPEVKKFVKEMVAKESLKKFEAYASIIVGMEMLANLSDQTHCHFDPCLKGIIAMKNHCLNSSKPRILQRMDMYLMGFLFQNIPRCYTDELNDILGSIWKVGDNHKKALRSAGIKYNIDEIKQHNNKSEKEFITKVLKTINEEKCCLSKSYPKCEPRQHKKKLVEKIKAAKFTESLYTKNIEIMATALGKKLSKNDKQQLLNKVKSDKPLIAEIFKSICLEIINGNFSIFSEASKENRWNWLWDYQISCHMSKETILVTDDKSLTRMLKNAGYENQVMRFKDYLSYLGMC